jgi:hypothetical protein
MSEESEMMLLMKELVTKVKQLEKAVYDKDNLLMKSGYVVVNTPTPSTTSGVEMADDKIAKMEWDEINKMVARIEGAF